MDRPTMFDPFEAAPDVHVLPAYFPIPVLGLIPVNAFVLKAAEPVLVDTGLIATSDEFMAHLSTIIDLKDLRWLWLTHAHFDHLGSFRRILDQAPRARVVTTFLGMGVMSLFQPLPPERVYLLNPGQTLDVGDRTLTAFRPPSFDSPETTGFYDARTGALFCADCFGALMPEPAMNAREVATERLRQGATTWATVDAPWLHFVDRGAFEERLDRVRELAPKVVFSSHLPVAEGMTEELLQLLAAAPEAEPFVGPDQSVLDEMLRGRRAA